MTRSRQPGPGAARPRALRVYVAAVVTLAAALTAGAAVTSSSTLGQEWPATVLVLLLLVQGHLLRVRSYYRQQHHDLNLVEAALAVLFVRHHAIDVAVLTAAATAVSMVVQHVRSPAKVAFNIAQWTVAAVLGYLAYDAVSALLDPATVSLAAIAAGTLVAMAVNQLTFTAAIWLASGPPPGPKRLGQDSAALVGRLISVAMTTTLGIVLAGAVAANVWATVFAFVPLGFLHWASKGYAEARADRARLAGLQRATHALSVAHTQAEAFTGLLREVRTSFETSGVELWLVEDGQPRRVASAGFPAHADEQATRALAAVVTDRLRSGTAAPTRVVSCAEAEPALAAYGCRDALLVPLQSQHGAVAPMGMLCLYERAGMEGFEEGELAVLAALAAEIVGYLERTTLSSRLIDEQVKTARIVEQASDGILTLSNAGVIRTWNSAFESMTGYAAREMVGTKHLGLLRICDEAGADVWLERWTAASALPERVRVRTASGEHRWLSCSFTRVASSEDSEETLIVVARDVTAAHELDRLKDDFVAVVSHELRTPLVPIKGWASVLLARGDRMSEEQRRDALTSIQAQAQRLERLVLNILDASRVEGGLGEVVEPVDVSAIAARVVEDLLPTSSTHVLRLLGATRPLMALGQSVWVERALANLVTNAVKYAPAGTTIDVTLTREGPDIALRVSDEGPGIPAAWRDRVFERFERVPDGATQTGTGLGLYITRQLAQAMGGRVELEHSDADGAVFCLRLRASSVAVPAPRSGSFSNAPLGNDIALPALDTII